MLDIKKYSGNIKIDDIDNLVLKGIILRNGEHRSAGCGFYFFASDKGTGNISLDKNYNDCYSDYGDHNAD